MRKRPKRVPVICKTCGKNCYPSKAEAIGYIARVIRRKNRDRLPCRAYWSEKCNTWHVTARLPKNLLQKEARNV